jgi:apolipoprotein N-acyltransferase
VAWVALVPLLWALGGVGGLREAARLGYLTGAVSALGLVYWASYVVTRYGGLGLPVGVAVMGALCLALALFPALFAALTVLFVRRLGPAGLLLSPLAWVGMELLRAHTFFRFPWCLLGYSQQPFPAVIQIARFTAVYGVSFVLAASSAVLAYTLRARRRRTQALAAQALLVAAVVGYGAWVLGLDPPSAGRLRVGLVQADVRQDEKWSPDLAWRNVERHVALTREAAARGAALVVWPESSVPYYFDHAPALSAHLRQAVAETGVRLLFGNDDLEPLPDGSRRVFVGAKLLEPAGEISHRYHKVRLVPFGEYVPLQPLLTLGGRYAAKLVDQVADFTPGTEASVAGRDGDAALGVFICYEAIFPDHVRRFARDGARLLVNVTNDAWYGYTSAPHQHLMMAAFRAVENGRYLVRAANTGISAVVDPRGRIVERTGLFTPAVVVRDVPLLAEETPYARHGDVFAWGCLGGALGLAIHALRPRRAAPVME